MYKARHYVSMAGRVYAPGEVIDQTIEEARIPRLLRLDAIEYIPDMPKISEKPLRQTCGSEEKDRELTRKNFEAQLNGLGYEADGNPTRSAVDEAEETDEDAEAMDIDIMDGIIPRDAPETQKSAGKRKKA